MARLVFSSPFMAREYQLTRQETSIGRLPGNGITIPDYRVFKGINLQMQKQLAKELIKISRKHAVIRLENDTYYIQDTGTSGIGSKYGTSVNNMRLESGKSYPLKSGDRIRFGSTECVFEQ